MNILTPITYMLVLFILFSIPDAQGKENLLTAISPDIQNLLHIPAYGVLAILWIFALKAYRFTERHCILGAIIITLGYSAAVEVYQAIVPGRIASMADFSLNLAGG